LRRGFEGHILHPGNRKGVEHVDDALIGSKLVGHDVTTILLFGAALEDTTKRSMAAVSLKLITTAKISKIT